MFLTLAHLDAERVRRRFPTIAAMCRQVGLDLATDLIPVGPAAHYLMGGIQTDIWARTSLPGLFAAGETARLLADPSERQLTIEESNRSAARGVNSVPTFAFGDRGLTTGGLSEEGFRTAIRQAVEQAREPVGVR